MDIWKWVWEAIETANEQGDHRLAELISSVPGYVVDDEYHKADSSIPEGLNLARQNNNKWLEIFFRHWDLQSRVLQRNQVSGQLPEAIDLVDFCHQEDTRDCPQSICVIQDLAQCYEGIDCLGYAEDRLAVADETLARINPSWPCFDCIGSEYANALIDLSKPQEALDWIHASRQQAQRMGETSKSLFDRTEVTALMALERWDEAYNCAKEMQNTSAGETFIRDQRNYLTITLAHLNRFGEALKQRLTFSEIKEGCSYFNDWSNGSVLLIEAGKLENNWEIDSQFDYMAEKLMQQGVNRYAIDISHRQAKLALLRKRPLTVKRCIERIQTLIPNLNKDLGASKNLQQLIADFDNANSTQSAYIFTSPQNIIESLDNDIELNLLKLSDGYKLFPEAEETVIELAQTLKKLHRTAEADAILSSFLSNFPKATRCLSYYGFSLLEQSQYDDFQALLGQQPPTDASQEYILNWHWLQAHFADKQQEKNIIKEHLQTILSIAPDSYNTLKWLAQLCCELEDYQTSITLWNKVIDDYDDEQQTHWDRMIPATLAQQWETVHESIAALGLDYSESGLQPGSAIDLCLETIRLQIESGDGEKNNYLARRTGPVSARIIKISSPYEDEQHYGNEYVFYPSPHNQLDQTDDDGYHCDNEGNYTLLFPVIKQTLNAGYKSFYIDGFYPGDECWQAFEVAANNMQMAIEKRSDESYELCYEEKDYPAIYAFIAIPDHTSKTALLGLLQDHFSHLKLPLIWPELLESTNNKQEAEKHRELEMFYDM